MFPEKCKQTQNSLYQSQVIEYLNKFVSINSVWSPEESQVYELLKKKYDDLHPEKHLFEEKTEVVDERVPKQKRRRKTKKV
jgi:hypothetical protein